jgi:hypothetical protein
LTHAALCVGASHLLFWVTAGIDITMMRSLLIRSMSEYRHPTGPHQSAQERPVSPRRLGDCRADSLVHNQSSAAATATVPVLRLRLLCCVMQESEGADRPSIP